MSIILLIPLALVGVHCFGLISGYDLLGWCFGCPINWNPFDDKE